MSETAQEEGKLLLDMGDKQYDLNVIGKALGFARDFVLCEDVRNAAKNLSAEVKPSPLFTAVEDAIGMLRELFDKYAQPTETEDESASPAADS